MGKVATMGCNKVEQMLDVATIKRVSKKDFQQSTGKWLKQAPIMITNHGVDEYLIQRATDVATIAVQKVDAVGKTVHKVEVEEETPTVNCLGSLYVPNCQEDRSAYACGCKKEEGKFLCERHGRG